MKRESEGLVGRSGRGLDSVNSVEEGLSLGNSRLRLLLPSLEPVHVGRLLQHVVSVPSRDGNESDSLGVETDFLNEIRSLLNNLLVSSLGPLGSVHLVDGNNELSDSEGESEESVLSSLPILRDPRLELSGSGGDDEDGAIGLGRSSDHV